MLANYMWFFRRSDVSKRNEWSNYTNWPYSSAPHQPLPVSQKNITPPKWYTTTVHGNEYPTATYGGLPNSTTSGLYSPANQKIIMINWALLLDGKYRENLLPAGVLNYVEKYVRTSGNGADGLYCYNFNLHSNPFDFQPSGAINMSKFNNVQMEVETNLPVLDENAQFNTICGPSTDDEIIGVSKPAYGIYEYTYDLVVMEERWNVLVFQNGMASLEFSR